MRAKTGHKIFPQHKFNGKWGQTIWLIAAYTSLTPAHSIEKIIFLSYCYCNDLFFGINLRGSFST